MSLVLAGGARSAAQLLDYGRDYIGHCSVDSCFYGLLEALLVEESLLEALLVFGSSTIDSSTRDSSIISVLIASHKKLRGGSGGQSSLAKPDPFS